jgi:hypothetical protein
MKIMTTYIVVIGLATSALAGGVKSPAKAAIKVPTPQETAFAERVTHNIIRAKADCIGLAIYFTNPEQICNTALIKQICDLAFEDKSYAEEAYQMILADVRAAGWLQE